MNNTQNNFVGLQGFFSDETELFRTPSEPDEGGFVTVRIRAPKLDGQLNIFLCVNSKVKIPMAKTASSDFFDIYEAGFTCGGGTTAYHFEAEFGGTKYIYQKDGLKEYQNGQRDTELDFCFTAGFHIPEWAKGAVQYQIFPDRFCNGDTANDVRDGEYSYNHRHIRFKKWDSPVEPDDYRCIYGGDISGIIKKLDYLQGLGVEVIYLNPVFLSPSSHKYDTQDYDFIDPHFGVIEDDADRPLLDWEHHNGYARMYIKRVLSRTNLEKSNALFALFCEECHKKGIKIILDGVFNHCGSYHRWMDKEGIYRDKDGYATGAYQDINSPYREYFNFKDEKPGFEAWWGMETLPKLCYEKSQKLCEEIFAVAVKWLKPPYCIDGWRLDVGADLGHSLEFNHKFWKEFRKRVKAVNPNAIILAEHYGDPKSWLCGDEWDTVMNYDAFMEPLTYFLTGMEKHSDRKRDDLYHDGAEFFRSMRKNMARFQSNSLLCAMNELSNHDHSRFLTRTNRTVGRLQSLGSEAASHGVSKAVFREAVAIQMTWPGAPTIYYGDEAGQVGWTDPDSRRTYPWGNEDTSLIEMHRYLIALHKEHSALRRGSLVELGAGYGFIAYARFDKSDCIAVICNDNDSEITLPIDLRLANAAAGDRFIQSFITSCDGWHDGGKITEFTGSVIDFKISPHTAIILTKERAEG
ncbi:MAG: glycoside hydrolase family 13 protein [Clostridia bacterium]|nr:glycoside hydrolase family 13 protein [Clostridia bacterium]